jgi:hypothetical protein
MTETFRTPRLLLMCACLTAAFAVSAAGQPKTVRNGRVAQEVAAVRSYAGSVDLYASRHARSVRVFASNADSESEGVWRELKSRGEKSQVSDANESASVWLKDGRVVLTRFTLQSFSGDWVHYVDHYFREDGTLAKIEARLNTFYGRVSAVREKFYGKRGELLQASEHIYRLGTKRKVRPGGAGEFLDQPIPVYKTTQELPFQHLLK